MQCNSYRTDEDQFIYRSHRRTAYTVEGQVTSSVAKFQFLTRVEVFSWKYTHEAPVSWSNWLGHKLDGLGFESQRGMRDSSVLQIIQIGSEANPPSYSVGTGVLSWKWGGQDMTTVCLHLVWRIRMSGAIPLLLYAYMVWTGMSILYFTLPRQKALYQWVQRLQFWAAFSIWCSQHT
jgi:hypothetical protein